MGLLVRGAAVDPREQRAEVLVRQLGLSPERVAVELNGELLRRTAYAATKLTDNDTLEIIHYVGGG